MFIASQLKKQNIVEYLLYMWQIEDLIRAFFLNIDVINEKIIEPYQISAEEKKQLYDWYVSLIDMMRSENVQQSGHIQLNKNIIILLNDFHQDMMKSGEEPTYNSKFYSVLPSLAALRQKQNEANISDIELCFNFLYGIMTLRLQKKEISQETQQAQEEISQFLSLLNTHYFRYLSGELQFD
ncbi:MAG TPA: DUF4924 family protein [Bacteroidales bacterium]|nr:DUF4924 family protein [Bacteroidales bacterium]